MTTPAAAVSLRNAPFADTALLERRVRPVAGTIVVNPLYAALLQSAGLTNARGFLELREEIISGHRDRQVSRVQIGDAAAYLKREHRVPFKERLQNWWHGFGFCSKSWREATILHYLKSRFAGSPEWMAVGELESGESFLLVRAAPAAVPLTERLIQIRDDEDACYCLARELGRTLAALHALGMIHRDLYSNHVLVDPETYRIVVVDWQRARHVGVVSTAARCRDIATLVATLPENGVTAEICRVLQDTYCEETQGNCSRALSPQVKALVAGLRPKRHIRSKLSATGLRKLPSLRCVDGDALRVSPAFRAVWGEGVPFYLREQPQDSQSSEFPLPDGGRGRLEWTVRAVKTSRGWTSPERRRMGMLFRLERCNVPAPRVLAEGQRWRGDGRCTAMLFTRLPGRTLPLESWLAQCTDRGQRGAILQEAGELLAGLHQAGCFWSVRSLDLRIDLEDESAPSVMIGSATDLVVRRWLRGWWRRRDLGRLLRLAPGEQNHIHAGYRDGTPPREARP